MPDDSAHCKNKYEEKCAVDDGNNNGSVETPDDGDTNADPVTINNETTDSEGGTPLPPPPPPVSPRVGRVRSSPDCIRAALIVLDALAAFHDPAA